MTSPPLGLLAPQRQTGARRARHEAPSLIRHITLDEADRPALPDDSPHGAKLRFHRA